LGEEIEVNKDVKESKQKRSLLPVPQNSCTDNGAVQLNGVGQSGDGAMDDGECSGKRW
jgi:hypothetical protein